MSKAKFQRQKEMLFSLKIVINVLFSLIIFQVFLILPRPEDPELIYNSLDQIFEDQLSQLLVMFVGLILTIIYWMQINKQLGNLERSSALHAFVCLLQMFCLMIYLYFVRFDMEFEGMALSLQMQSVFLGAAGLLGALNWINARHNGLTSDQIDDDEERKVFFELLPEPVTSLIALPFASISPDAWSACFLLIIPLTWFFRKLGSTTS